MYRTEEDILDSIVDELTIELKNTVDFRQSVLESKVADALREVVLKRNYSATSFSDEQIVKDLSQFYVVIKNLARYDYNMIGIEGQTSSVEDGVSRRYISRASLMSDVLPFIKVL